MDVCLTLPHISLSLLFTPPLPPVSSPPFYRLCSIPPNPPLLLLPTFFPHVFILLVLFFSLTAFYPDFSPFFLSLPLHITFHFPFFILAFSSHFPLSPRSSPLKSRMWKIGVKAETMEYYMVQNYRDKVSDRYCGIKSSGRC